MLILCLRYGIDVIFDKKLNEIILWCNAWLMVAEIKLYNCQELPLLQLMVIVLNKQGKNKKCRQAVKICQIFEILAVSQYTASARVISLSVSLICLLFQILSLLLMYASSFLSTDRLLKINYALIVSTAFVCQLYEKIGNMTSFVPFTLTTGPTCR